MDEFVSTGVANKGVKDIKGISLFNAEVTDQIKLKLVLLIERGQNDFHIVNDHILLAEKTVQLSQLLRR